MEAFDLALGLRVVGVAVLLGDAQAGEKAFEVVVAMGESCGVDAIRCRSGWMRAGRGVGGVGEAGDDIGAGDAAVGGAGQQVSGVVVEPVEDLGVGAVGQSPVGEVGLPAFVGLLGGEADVGAAWGVCVAGGRSGHDGAGCGGSWRSRGPAALAGEVPLQGGRAGVEALGGETFAQRHDRRDDLVGDGVWGCWRGAVSVDRRHPDRLAGSARSGGRCAGERCAWCYYSVDRYWPAFPIQSCAPAIPCRRG